MNISIVVPCYKPHFKYIKRFIQNIELQTIYPKQIIFSLSECLEENFEKIKKYESKIPLKYTITENKALAWENRNRGYELVDTEYIMFMDIDDTYHPQKIEITEYFLNKYKPNLLLHSYYKKSWNLNLPIRLNPENIFVSRNKKIKENTFNINNKNPYNIIAGFTVAHGIITVKKDVMDKIKFKNFERGEDGIFCRDVLKLLGRVIAIKCVLMIYNK